MGGLIWIEFGIDLCWKVLDFLGWVLKGHLLNVFLLALDFNKFIAEV